MSKHRKGSGRAVVSETGGVMRELTEEQVAERLERAKAIRRREDQVVAHWLERLTVAQSAERLGVSARTVYYLRRHLRLSCGYAWRAGEERMGRTVAMRVEVVR